MSSKNKIIIIFFIVAVAVSVWLYLQNSSGTIRSKYYDFAIDDTSSISQINLSGAGKKQIILEKTESGKWMVNTQFAARADAVKNLLTCIKEMRVKNPVAKDLVEAVEKRVESADTKVEIFKGDKRVRLYYVDADDSDGVGTTMLLCNPRNGEKYPFPFVMYIPGFNGFLSVRYMPDADFWKERTVFAFYPDQISSISVKYPHMPDSSFMVSINGSNKISVTDNKGRVISGLDTATAKRYIMYYINIQYETLKNDLPKAAKDSAMIKGPVQVIELKDREGKIYSVKTFPKLDDNSRSLTTMVAEKQREDINRMYALINNDKDFAVIQFYIFGKLFQTPSYFIKEKIATSPSVKK